LGLAIGILSLPYFVAREYIHRTFFHQSWLNRNERAEKRLDAVLERDEELLADEPPDESWRDMFGRLRKRPTD
jgi:hypothetical protein